MASRVLSIEIGYSLTKVCEIDYKVKNPKIYKTFVMETPSDLFKEDVITDHPIFSGAIRDKINELGIHTKNCIFTIASSKIASREVAIPAKIKENRIQSLVNMNAKDYFPIDLSGYKIAYTVIRRGIMEGTEEKMNLLVLAAPKNLLESYVRFGRTCGLEAVALDYNGNSLYETIKPLHNEETKMYVKVDEKNSYCMVMQGQDVIFTRNLTYGIDDAIETIIENKTFKDINTYLDAVDLVRRKKCIYGSTNAEEQAKEVEDRSDMVGTDSKAWAAAKAKVTESLAVLTGSIARAIDFYRSKNYDNPVKFIQLTGIGADFSGLQKLISNETGIDCKVLATVDGLRFDKSTASLPVGEYITCIGASINPVNFLTKEEELQGTKKKKDYMGACVLFLVLCIVTSVALVVMAILPLLEEQTKEAYYMSKIRQYESAYPVFEEYLDTKYSYDKLAYYSGAIDGNNNYIVDFINEMEQKLPTSTRVQSFASTDEGVSMSLSVSTKSEAAELIEQFKTFKSVANVSVNSISVTVSELGEESCSFSVTITYKPVSEYVGTVEE